MPKFRKKPVVIEAVQWTGENIDDIVAFCPSKHSITGGALSILTMEGPLRASLDDWVIKGVKGEFYPCKPDIFEQTYERVE